MSFDGEAQETRRNRTIAIGVAVAAVAMVGLLFWIFNSLSGPALAVAPAAVTTTGTTATDAAATPSRDHVHRTADHRVLDADDDVQPPPAGAAHGDRRGRDPGCAAERAADHAGRPASAAPAARRSPASRTLTSPAPRATGAG